MGAFLLAILKLFGYFCLLSLPMALFIGHKITSRIAPTVVPGVVLYLVGYEFDVPMLYVCIALAVMVALAVVLTILPRSRCAGTYMMFFLG